MTLHKLEASIRWYSAIQIKRLFETPTTAQTMSRSSCSFYPSRLRLHLVLQQKSTSHSRWTYYDSIWLSSYYWLKDQNLPISTKFYHGAVLNALLLQGTGNGLFHFLIKWIFSVFINVDVFVLIIVPITVTSKLLQCLNATCCCFKLTQSTLRINEW